MARAYSSITVDTPAGLVWETLRDFGSIASWHPSVIAGEIEDGLDPDVIGCVRSLRLADLTHVREELTALDDIRRRLAWRSDKPGFPVTELTAEMRVYPVVHGGGSLVEWEARFDEKAGEEGIWENVLGNGLFSFGLKGLAKALAGRGADGATQVERPPWPPHKVWTSRVLAAPVDRVWAVARDFSGMDAWHPDITRMRMEGDVRPDKVSGIREFLLGSHPVRQQLLHLDDVERSFSYRILSSHLPVRNYVAELRLWPVTQTNQTFAVWTGDWDATPKDDETLVPTFENGVYQTALAALEALLKEAEPAEPADAS
jgi:uncharacterized membrane protein